MDPFSLALGGVGLVGNLIGGIFGNSAAKKAAQVQSDAANKAASDVTAATAAANPQIGAAATRAGDLATGAASTGNASAVDAAHAAAAGVSEAANNANGILQPYQTAGSTASDQLNKGVAEGGQFNHTPTMADIQIDPGYAFRLQQGQDALMRSGAARGGALGGSAAKDLNTFAQNSASQEYQNAFNRYETNRQNNYADILGVSGQGLQAGTTQGNNLTAAARYGGDTVDQGVQFGAGLNTNAAQYTGSIGYEGTNQMASNTINTAKTAADYQTSGAAAKASGIVGGANALTSGISGGINSATSALTLGKLLANPAVSAPYGSQAPYSGSTVNPDGSLTVHR